MYCSDTNMTTMSMQCNTYGKPLYNVVCSTELTSNLHKLNLRNALVRYANKRKTFKTLAEKPLRYKLNVRTYDFETSQVIKTFSKDFTISTTGVQFDSPSLTRSVDITNVGLVGNVQHLGSSYSRDVNQLAFDGFTPLNGLGQQITTGWCYPIGMVKSGREYLVASRASMCDFVPSGYKAVVAIDVQTCEMNWVSVLPQSPVPAPDLFFDNPFTWDNSHTFAIGDVVAAASAAGVVHLLNAANGELLKRFDFPHGIGGGISASDRTYTAYPFFTGRPTGFLCALASWVWQSPRSPRYSSLLAHQTVHGDRRSPCTVCFVFMFVASLKLWIRQTVSARNGAE